MGAHHAQPFSVRASARIIELSGAVPLCKLHGSLSWTIEDGRLVLYQDCRAALRLGASAAIVPPLPEKDSPAWLRPVWEAAEAVLTESAVWVVCGYSAPRYDQEVRALLRRGAKEGKRLLLMDPHASDLASEYKDIAPTSEVVPGVPPFILGQVG